MKRLLALVLFAALALGCCREKGEPDLTAYVDPFIGTSGTGHCFPNATLPFGLVQPGPVSGTAKWDYTGGYQFQDKELYGFAQTAISGTGCSDLGDLRLQPFSGEGNAASDFKYTKAFEACRCDGRRRTGV